MMNENYDAISRLLLDIEVLDKIESKLANFNAFETLGIVNTEIRHSNVLAWLLSPKENHGLGDFVLKKFIQTVYHQYKDSFKEISLYDVSLMDYYNFHTRREWRNIDILAVSDEDEFVLVIENKIWSKESKNQLNKYFKTVNEEYPTYRKMFIFLTPYGDEASDGENWISIDYTTILDIVEKALKFKQNILNSSVQFFIEQYIQVLRRYIVGDKELEKLCREIYYKHQKALDLIFQYKPDIYSDVYNYLENLLNKNIKLIMDVSNKSFIRFTTNKLDDLIPKVGEGWTNSKRILLWEFQNKDEKLVLKLIIGPGERLWREKLFNISQKYKGIFKGSSNSLGVQYTTIYKKEILQKNYSEKYDFELIKEKIQNEMNSFIKDDLIGIEEVIANNL
ncbi:MAG: PD-(D/E)XK nuclease family protein [Bacillus sp. (in: Bacteria)]|nr:PD-(D/E)XK nuclease family protein [Bacillus sp. (in: firmicutes)]